MSNLGDVLARRIAAYEAEIKYLSDHRLDSPEANKDYMNHVDDQDEELVTEVEALTKELEEVKARSLRWKHQAEDLQEWCDANASVVRLEALSAAETAKQALQDQLTETRAQLTHANAQWVASQRKIGRTLKIINDYDKDGHYNSVSANATIGTVKHVLSLDAPKLYAPPNQG